MEGSGQSFFASNGGGSWTPEQIQHREQATQKTRSRMGKFYEKNQLLGRRNPIGCVSLEITQRCNLDCTCCYLSENSESVKDLPLEEIFRRIDMIYENYGFGTDIQVSGGDPTLRKHTELVQIVRYIREKGMCPALFTNGIAASRKLLEQLVEAGLEGIAFHVDLTQERKGFTTEVELNKIREEYIARTRGLPLAVFFNTTVTAATFKEIPKLVEFFKKNADVVRIASFQLQADTGRGVWRERDEVISIDTVRKQVEKGAGTSISWNTLLIGHPQCNRYGITLEANGKLYDLNDNPEFFNKFLEEFRHVRMDSRYPRRVVWSFLKEAFKRPIWVARAIAFFVPKIWQMKTDIIKARGRVNKIGFFVKNFMHASALDHERVEACSFMVMTKEGPVSMCAHNAQRDNFILQPVQIQKEGEKVFWDPLTGKAYPVDGHASAQLLASSATPSSNTTT